MIKKIGFLCALCTTQILFAQEEMVRYEQSIAGMEVQFSMEAIPGGEFRMGSVSGNDDERPVRVVKLDPFWMSTYEVTWDLYEPFLYKDLEVRKSTDGHVPEEVDAVTRPTKPYLDMTFGMGKEGRPAVGMTHYNAIQFCKWLYIRTENFYRLPTEAEWEYACRAGSTSSYFFGEDAAELDDYAWYSGNSEGKVQKVGEKRPNAWGLYDMTGNVAEWVYDQYLSDFYSLRPPHDQNPMAPPISLYPHVVRGGSFESDPSEMRSSARSASDPTWKQIDPQIPKSNWWFPEAPFVGIRLVRPLNPPSHEEIMAYYDKKPIEDF